VPAATSFLRKILLRNCLRRKRGGKPPHSKGK
jgi:hypothetical protein